MTTARIKSMYREEWLASERITHPTPGHAVVYVEDPNRQEIIASVWMPSQIGRNRSECEEEVFAIARLLAAAPKLLAALDRLVEQSELTSDFEESEHSTLRSAVTQARKALGAAIAC